MLDECLLDLDYRGVLLTYCNIDAYAVLEEIIKVATLAKAGDYEAIDELDRLGHSYKWKIAFLYSGEKLIPVYNRGMLISLASHLGMQRVNKAKTVEIHEVTDDIRIGPFGTMLHKSDYVSDGIPVINPQHI